MVVVGRAILACPLLWTLACGGNKARPADDAERQPSRPDGAAPAAIDAAAPAAKGDLQVRVEWKDVPVVARSSPGRTACNTPRAPAVAPTTTWGIPDAFVIVEGAPVKSDARLVLADCALAPRVAVGKALVVESAQDRPATVSLLAWGKLAGTDVVAAPGGTDQTIQLPIAGHSALVPLTAGGIYRLTAGEETAWMIAGAAYATDAAGQVLVEDLPAGPHAVTAWIPPRAGQPARIAKGTATVVADGLAELVLAPAP